MSLQAAIAAYHVQRFPQAQVEHVALKLAEEAGEVASAVNGHVSGGDFGKGDVVGEAVHAAFSLLALVGRWFPARDLLAEVETELARYLDPNGGHRSCLPGSPESVNEKITRAHELRRRAVKLEDEAYAEYRDRQ